MKVLVLSPTFPPDSGAGVAVFVSQLCLELSRQGYQIDVLSGKCRNFRQYDVKQLYRIYRYPNLSRLSSLIPILMTLILGFKNKYDIVFLGHFRTTSSLGVYLLKKVFRIPYVILSHGNDIWSFAFNTQIDMWVAKILLLNTSMILANSTYTKKRISQTYYKGKIKVLNPGVDIARFNPDVDTTKVHQQYNLNGRRVLITTARLVKKKNIDGVLIALSKVIQQVPEFIYLVIGNGEERAWLETLCDELELRSHVRFLGYIENSQLPALYCTSDVFVMPSLEETFGISFTEANACGVPVIGGLGGGMVDAVIDGETGLLVNPHNTDEIAKAIVRLLIDRDLAHHLGENGRRRVLRELTWEKVGDRLIEFIQSVV